MQSSQLTPLNLGSIILSASKTGIAPLAKLSKKRIELGPEPLGHNEKRERVSTSL